MKSPRYISFCFIALLVLLAVSDLCAQWKNVAPNLIRGTIWGAIHYKDGSIWAGRDDLFSSNDTGKTWTKNVSFFGKQITDIQFYDKTTGIVAADGLYLTNDAGNSWKKVSNFVNYFSVSFGTSASIIYVLGGYPASFDVSLDGGQSWRQISLQADYGLSFTLSKDGWIHAFVGNYGLNSTGSGWVTSSNDQGMTWFKKNGVVDGDCYSISADSCNAKKLYLSNEDYAFKDNGFSEVFLSSDAGDSWQTVLSYIIPNISGAGVCSSNATYIGSRSNSIYRSTDHGVSWKSFTGPKLLPDSRSIAPINDNLILVLDTVGNIWATNNSCGDSLNISPYGSLSIAPRILFEFDTLHCNDSIAHSLSIKYSGCAPPSISSWSVIGKDSLSYSPGNLTNDSLHIKFSPKTSGSHTASLIILLNDGSKDTIALKGYNVSKPFSFTANPQNLFTSDSIYICDKKTEKFILNTGGCLPKVISQKIVGSNAVDYGILKQIIAPLSNLDSVFISFNPSDSGFRNATYEITFDDGTKISIPLLGYGIAPHPLSLSTTDQANDTIGGSVYVPITINGLDHAEDIDLILHYDKELTFHGSFSPLNLQLDMPKEQWTGRSKLHIAQAKPNIILGYARFDVFNDSLSKSTVTFDSITVLTAVAPCQYILPASVTSIITPPFGCGIQTISRFMHNGIMPQLSIIPNPTSGEISILSTHDLGECSIAIYDMLGTQCGRNNVKISKDSPAKFLLPISNGVYNVRVKDSERTYDLRVVVNR